MSIQHLWLRSGGSREITKVKVLSVTIKESRGSGGTVQVEGDNLRYLYSSPEAAEQDIVVELENQVMEAKQAYDKANKELNDFNRGLNLKNRGGEEK